MARALAWGCVYAIVICSSVAILASLYMMLMHEWTRWNECDTRCTERRISNMNLMTSQVCESHHGYGESIRLECKRAVDENQLSDWQCRTRLFWKESELNRVYSMYTESHWMLFGIAATGVGTAVIALAIRCLCPVGAGSLSSPLPPLCGGKGEEEEEKLQLTRQFNDAMRQSIEVMNSNASRAQQLTLLGGKFSAGHLSTDLLLQSEPTFVHGKSRKRQRPLVLRRKQYLPSPQQQQQQQVVDDDDDDDDDGQIDLSE